MQSSFEAFSLYIVLDDELFDSGGQIFGFLDKINRRYSYTVIFDSRNILKNPVIKITKVPY